MAESPPSPFMRTFTALVDQVRAELSDQPFKVTPDIASAVSAMAYKTVDFWFASLRTRVSSWPTARPRRRSSPAA
jgi:hypothetical protein